ncbi:MAG: glycerophosphodiester phosphodiesterase [Gemmatimonadetes bacterium]|nr:glycerophosphodiester phosphodiesterase [Gemmatimonadota bacterium]
MPARGLPRHAPAPPPALGTPPLLVAHRGGAGLAPENTLAAFESAARDWAVDMIELDVRATADGACVVIHDPTVDRTTDGTGPVARFTLAELRRLDAGHRFTPDGGRTFPFRGRGVRIPTIEEVLQAVPTLRLTVEVKIGTAQAGLFAALSRHGAEARVVAGGMYDADRTAFRTYPGALSASSEQVRRFLVAHTLRLGRLVRVPAHVVQLCELWEGRRLVRPRLVRDLHRQQVHLHVWTVNDEADMHRLLDWGVDGIISDFPDRVARVLHERTGRPLPPALS